MTKIQGRREFIKHLAAATGGIVMAPALVSCGGSDLGGGQSVSAKQPTIQDETTGKDIPLARPADWDSIVFNRERGNAGAIPQSYIAEINGPDGEIMHLGKHLPYVPQLNPDLVPEGYLPLMWGDAARGYARHPNSPLGAKDYPRGHWYNWVRVRLATGEDAEEVTSEFTGWPKPGTQDSGKYAVFGSGDIAADSGKNTIYLVALPSGVSPEDTIRIHAHCLYHGEYVDFLTTPQR